MCATVIFLLSPLSGPRSELAGRVGQVPLFLLFHNLNFLAAEYFGFTIVIRVLLSISLNIETILSAHSKRDNFIKGSSEVLIKERVDSGINQTVKIS